jgi:hypothetical protein
MMGRPIITLAILLGLSVCIVCEQKTKPEEHQEKTKQSPTPAIISPAVATQIGQPTTAPEYDSAQNQPLESIWNRLLDALISNWPLVAIGIPGIWAALRTLGAIQRQADAMVNSERAWLVAELIPICNKFGNQWHRPAGNGWVPLSEDEILSGYHLRHSLKITNLGRTGASIDEVTLRNEFLEEDRSNLYAIDRGMMTVIGYDYTIGGGESSHILQADVNEWKSELIRNVGDSKKHVLLYGLVSYFHVFDSDDRQECWFRYVYNPDIQQLARISPKEKEYEDHDSEIQKHLSRRK